MNEELKQLEIELAKVRLAKEQLELRDALKRAQRQQAISDKTEKVVAVGRNAAHNSSVALSDATSRTPVPWKNVFVYYTLSAALFAIYVAGLPDSKHNMFVIAFFASCAVAILATNLLLKKLIQLVLN